jgi:hypothetical protein
MIFHSKTPGQNTLQDIRPYFKLPQPLSNEFTATEIETTW